MGIQYKGAATSRSFKQLGAGLRAGEDRLREQRKIEADSIKLAKLQSAQASKAKIGGIETAGRFEEGVLKEKQNLENEARQNSYEAFKKFAEKDIGATVSFLQVQSTSILILFVLIYNYS